MKKIILVLLLLLNLTFVVFGVLALMSYFGLILGLFIIPPSVLNIYFLTTLIRGRTRLLYFWVLSLVVLLCNIMFLYVFYNLFYNLTERDSFDFGNVYNLLLIAPFIINTLFSLGYFLYYGIGLSKLKKI